MHSKWHCDIHGAITLLERLLYFEEWDGWFPRLTSKITLYSIQNTVCILEVFLENQCYLTSMYWLKDHHCYLAISNFWQFFHSNMHSFNNEFVEARKVRGKKLVYHWKFIFWSYKYGILTKKEATARSHLVNGTEIYGSSCFMFSQHGHFPS